MKKITLYHTTDIHGQIMPKSSNTRMGMVKVSSFLKSVRSENSNILILNSGDCVSGDPICDLTNGLSLIDAMNICGYSASCIGNHDFDFGKENISHLIERAKFKFVCANREHPTLAKSLRNIAFARKARIVSAELNG